MPDNDHKYYGIEFNQMFWRLWGKTDKTEEECLDMLNYAYASLTHWKLYQGSTIVNQQRGEYLIAKCYLYMGEAGNCAKYAKSCLDKTLDHKDKMADFDIAFAWELMAKSEKLSGNLEAWKEYYDHAVAAGRLITDDKDREIFESDLASEY